MSVERLTVVGTAAHLTVAPEPDDDLFALAVALQTLAQVSPGYVVLVDRLLPKDER